jgi:hypothetical protein
MRAGSRATKSGLSNASYVLRAEPPSLVRLTVAGLGVQLVEPGASGLVVPGIR